MVTDDNYAYHSEHLVMHMIVKSLYCTPETNTGCQLFINLKKTGLLHHQAT